MQNTWNNSGKKGIKIQQKKWIQTDKWIQKANKKSGGGGS